MYEQLMEAMVQDENMRGALKEVVKNGGAPGIDQMSVKELAEHLPRHWGTIQRKLLDGTYVPSPVKRVEIPKAGGGVRMLGIPTVLDRCIQQMMLRVLTPIYEARFSEHSYGFRPGRSAQEAVRVAQKRAKEGRRYVVDIDITKFFDHVNHDILMAEIGKTIGDKRIKRLIGKYLRAGAMIEGVKVKGEEGTPQGGPLSPLLANIYLDRLDKELEKRGHAFVRYADDCNVYVQSESAARRVEGSIVEWIGKNLRLQVNKEKSGTGAVWERKFLGFQLNERLEIGIAPKSREHFQDKVRELWRSCQSLSSKGLREQWCAWLRGWCSYYKLAEDRRSITELEGWIRRHMRCCFWQRWHSVQGRWKRLKKLGCTSRLCKTASSSRGAWRIARSPSLQTALSNKTLHQWGFLMPSEAFG